MADIGVDALLQMVGVGCQGRRRERKIQRERKGEKDTEGEEGRDRCRGRGRERKYVV